MRVDVDDLDDPRLAPYRALKERELAAEGGRFIAEGEYITRRLLASRYAAESVLVSRRKVAAMEAAVPADVPMYVLSDVQMKRLVGFSFHTGVLGCGLRGPRLTLRQAVPAAGPCTLVLCPEMAALDNLGSLIRIAAAFGVDALVLGERCCDPFFRRVIRVSMGTVFRLPIVQCDDFLADLGKLREGGVELLATVLHGPAELLAGARRGPRLGLLFGNEAQGLDEASLARCQRRVTIPMHHGTDSLNVSVAAGIFLYHFTTIAPSQT